MAVARYSLGDLESAMAGAQEAIRPDQKTKAIRAEYVLGRILEAKGDLAGAKEHMSRYLTLDPNVADAVLIRSHIENLGKQQSKGSEPDLELP